jgi:hypothetical protein
MRDIYFESVTIETEKIGQLRTINSVTQAAELLFNGWPIDHGEKLEAAKRTCPSALEGKLSAGATRAAFIDAALEAGIHIVPFIRRQPTGCKSGRLRRGARD